MKKSGSEPADLPAEPLERARLQAEVAKQRVRIAKDELKRALKAYKGSVLLISHEPEFYREVATDVWNCESWTTKLF